MEVARGRIADIDLAFGGVSPRPWQDPVVDALLYREMPSVVSFPQAADTLLASAAPRNDKAIKLPQLRRKLIATLDKYLRKDQPFTAHHKTNEPDRLNRPDAMTRDVLDGTMDRPDIPRKVTNSAIMQRLRSRLFWRHDLWDR